MTNHLVRRHASPTTLTIGVHPGKSVEHFVAVGYLTESFHFAKATLSIQMGYCDSVISQPGAQVGISLTCDVCASRLLKAGRSD
jgi:hypothetical protein